MNQLSEYRKDQKRLIDDAATGNQRPPRISIRENKFALIDPSGNRIEIPFLPEGAVLDVIFVDRNEKISKLFWRGTYNEDNPNPPVCWSDNGVAPSETVTTMGEPQSATCMACPNNIMGSAISTVSGKKVKACIDLKKLAVVVVKPEGVYPGVYLLEIKPGSFKAWNNYLAWLRMQKLPEGDKPDLADVITRITFAGVGTMKFDPLNLIDPDSELAHCVIDVWERNKQADYTGQMVGRYDVPIEDFVPLAAPATNEDVKLIGKVDKITKVPMSEIKEAYKQSPTSTQPTPQEKVSQRAAVKKKPADAQQIAANHGMQSPQQGPAPSERLRRLDSLAKLPTVK